MTNKKKPTHIAFDLFRYHILPKNQIEFQRKLFEDKGIKSLKDLLRKKNKLFFTALKEVEEFSTHTATIRHMVLHKDKSCILYRFAVSRSITRETENFTEEELENCPSFLVFVWNESDKQLIAIQERRTAFKQTDGVAKAIIAAVNRELGRYDLRVHVEALFFENDFWDLIKQNVGRIKDIRFEIITPNMSNISKVLSDELKEFAKSTNTAQTNLDIIADPDSSILIDSSDDRVKGLVTYSSEGGGNISIKLRGLSRRVHTKKSTKHTDITELEIEGKDPQEIVNIVKKLLS